MAENSSSGGTSIFSAPARSDDPAWAHGRVVVGSKNASICIHCNKRINGGGVTRLKYHLAGIRVSNDEEVEEGDAANPHLGDIHSQTNRRLTMQGTIRSAMASKEMEHNARKVIATWWFDANIPFNSAKSYYYQPMIDAVTSMGPGFKGPLYHDLRGSLLKDVVHDVHEYILSIKADWRLYGCSIMADGWSNRRNVPIVNFLAYSPRGTVFLKSVDTSGLRKDKETLLEMFDEVVKEVGKENIVQLLVIMSFIKAAETLIRKEFTNGNDLCHPGITRFATHFLSIQCLLKFKNELRQMFTCTKWVESSHGKSRVGKEIVAIVLEDKDFWPRCAHIVNVSEPLIQVLSTITRLVPDCDIQDIISGQIEEYKKATGDFGMSLAIRQREKLNPELQKFAIRVLSQCCSATGAKEIGVNLSKTRDALDPISLDNIDLLNEWICEEPSLLDGEDIS
uniref:BED-type domain-containing protein n=1 Tax=Salix viminalis TaxID=40686 RepID=A0A6N2KZR3_SALVM